MIAIVAVTTLEHSTALSFLVATSQHPSHLTHPTPPPTPPLPPRSKPSARTSARPGNERSGASFPSPRLSAEPSAASTRASARTRNAAEEALDEDRYQRVETAMRDAVLYPQKSLDIGGERDAQMQRAMAELLGPVGQGGGMGLHGVRNERSMVSMGTEEEEAIAEVRGVVRWGGGGWVRGGGVVWGGVQVGWVCVCG